MKGGVISDFGLLQFFASELFQPRPKPPGVMKGESFWLVTPVFQLVTSFALGRMLLNLTNSIPL